jgi:hypothetical protein
LIVLVAPSAPTRNQPGIAGDQSPRSQPPDSLVVRSTRSL